MQRAARRLAKRPARTTLGRRNPARRALPFGSDFTVPQPTPLTISKRRARRPPPPKAHRKSNIENHLRLAQPARAGRAAAHARRQFGSRQNKHLGRPPFWQPTQRLGSGTDVLRPPKVFIIGGRGGRENRVGDEVRNCLTAVHFSFNYLCLRILHPMMTDAQGVRRGSRRGRRGGRV
jgi:hypothetical protein